MGRGAESSHGHQASPRAESAIRVRFDAVARAAYLDGLGWQVFNGATDMSGIVQEIDALPEDGGVLELTQAQVDRVTALMPGSDLIPLMRA